MTGDDSDGTVRTSRRGALAALAAFAAIPALPALGGMRAAFPDDSLHAYAGAVGADPQVAALGLAAAGQRDAHALEAALRARLPGPRDAAGWRAGLVEAARADIARGAWVEVAGRRLVRVEADFLGLAARLRPLA